MGGSGTVEIKGREFLAIMRSHWVDLPKETHRATAGPDGLFLLRHRQVYVMD